MKTLQKTALVAHRTQDMFDLVADVVHYPQFLPWCAKAEVLARDDCGMTAKLDVAWAGLKYSWTTRNTHVSGQRIDMQLVEGPFSQMQGCWQFVTVGEQAHYAACKVVFELSYVLAGAGLATLVGPVFHKITNSLVDAFVRRADEVYG